MARIEDVVIRQKYEKLGLGESDQTVEVSDRTKVAFGACVVDPAVAEGPHDVRGVVPRRVIAHDQAEACEGLSEDALDRLPEQPSPVESGNADSDCRGAHCQQLGWPSWMASTAS